MGPLFAAWLDLRFRGHRGRGSVRAAGQFPDHEAGGQFGGAKTLISHPASITLSGVARELGEEIGLSDALIRISVGSRMWRTQFQKSRRASNTCDEFCCCQALDARVVCGRPVGRRGAASHAGMLARQSQIAAGAHRDARSHGRASCWLQCG